MEGKKMLNDVELEKVTGGAKTMVEIDDQKLATGDIRDPADVQTREEALKIAELLGDGKNMGTWQTMSGEQYMQLWDSIHQNF